MRLTYALAAGAGLSLSLAAQAGIVHTASMPGGISSAFKNTGNFLYLEPETSTQAAAHTLATVDQNNTFFRTSATPSDSWGAAVAYDNALFGARGDDKNSYPSIQVVWENVSAPLSAGSYNIYVRALTGASGSETFTLTAADSLAGLSTGVVSNTATTTAAGAVTWVNLGVINVADGTDTFRLTASTTLSAARVDTVLIVPVPEAASFSFVIVGALALLARKR